jgi:pyrroloquinoline quinone biosynthesis protein D
MSAEAQADEDTVPHLARGVRLHYDEVRSAWVLLAPERLFQPDDVALEVLRLVDGERSVRAIIDSLASRYQAPRALIAADVVTMLQNLNGRGAISL